MSDHLRLVVRPEGPTERAAVLALVRRAFSADEAADADEAEKVVALVEAMHTEAATVGHSSLVALAEGALVGHVGLTRGWVDARDRLVEIQVLSPLSVDPALQRRGVGTALLRAAAERADNLGSPLVLLEGDPAFYRRRGYVAAHTVGLARPSDRIPRAACQVLLLDGYDASVAGRLVYPDLFWRLDLVGLRDPILETIETHLRNKEGSP